MTEDPVRSLKEVEGELEALHAAEGEDVFSLYYEHADVDVAAHEKRRRDALLAPEVAAACEAILAGDYDASSRRRAKIVSDWVTLARAETDDVIDLKEEIQKIVINVKPTLDGEEIPRHRKTSILFKEADRDVRRRAFQSEGKLREELFERARRLYRLRNDAAQALGYEDYPSLALEGEALTLSELKDLIDKYERATRQPYEELMAEGVGRFQLDKVEPWDVHYVTDRLCAADDKYFPNEAALPSLADVVKGFGLDLEALGIALHADADIPYGGLCFAIRIPDDVRILLNLKDGMSDLRVLYHEFGHAVHRKFTAAENFSLKVGDAGFFAEAMADTWALLVDRPAWLRRFTKMPEDEIARVADAAEKSFAARVRRFMAAQSFEIDAYRNADGDLAATLDDYAERFLGYRYGDDGMWAEQYFPLLYPMYSKNYMLARVVQRAVHGYLEREYGEPLGEPKAFGFLADRFYADGALRTWKEKLAAVGMEL
ncbi:MAG TPA: M3 family metallopeptidase [bacterium]|nr:M3 family metallopeptidase [bacterium]